MSKPNETLKALVDKFLAWELPASVCPDLCTNVSKATYPGKSIGTNLLTAAEAEEMIKYLGLYPCPCHPAVKQTMRSHEVELRCSHLNGCNNIMEELKEHTNAVQGEDAYLRIYPCDARKILEAVAAPQPATQPVLIPEGWQLVPKHPTEEMLTAGLDQPVHVTRLSTRTWVWEKMLDAAPAYEESPSEKHI